MYLEAVGAPLVDRYDSRTINPPFTGTIIITIEINSIFRVAISGSNRYAPTNYAIYWPEGIVQVKPIISISRGCAADEYIVKWILRWLGPCRPALTGGSRYSPRITIVFFRAIIVLLAVINAMGHVSIMEWIF
jgi:hypothetical protein